MIQGRRSKRGDQEPATRPIHLNVLELASVSWVRRPSGSTCSTPGVRPANGRAESIVRACGAYVAGRRATVNRERTVAFDEERLAIVKDRLRDVMLSTITGEMIEDGTAMVPEGWPMAVRCRLGDAPYHPARSSSQLGALLDGHRDPRSRERPILIGSRAALSAIGTSYGLEEPRSVDDMSLEPNDYAFISAWDAAQGIYHVRVRAVVAGVTSGSSGEIAVVMP